MSPINFSASAPKAYILAGDGLSNTINPDEDQIWSLNLGDSDNQILQIETTYGLQAKSMKLIPFLRINKESISKSSLFLQPSIVKNVTPTSIRTQFFHELDLEICFDVIIPQEKALMGAVEFRNTGKSRTNVHFNLAAVLVPMEQGVTIHPEKIGVNHILVGRTKEIIPVLFMSDAPTAISNPYPALSKTIKIRAGGTHSLTWVLVSDNSQEKSFEQARKLSAVNCQNLVAENVRQVDAHTIHIQTGDPNWDAAILLSQTIAQTHLAKIEKKSQNQVFIKTRLHDHKLEISTLSILEAFQFAQVLLPAKAQTMSMLLETLLEEINLETNKPSLNNTKTSVFSTCPMIAHLWGECMRIHPDKEQLQRVFPQLVAYYQAQIPEKSNQLLSDFPVFEASNQLHLQSGDYKFDSWHSFGGGLDIQKVISPALASMLYREFNVIQKMAYQINDRSSGRRFGSLRKAARDQILSCWHQENKFFTYLDHTSQATSAREWFSSGNVQQVMSINREFSTPQRLLCHLFSDDENTKSCIITFEGLGESGKLLMEESNIPATRWVMGRTHVTTNFLFNELHKVIIEGLTSEDRYVLENVDLKQPDITCLLPIWSGGAKKKTFEALIESLRENLTQNWEYGIPETWVSTQSLPENLTVSVNVLWNTLIIEGLLQQGFQEEACIVFTKLMGNIVNGLIKFSGFYPTYDHQSGQPIGLENAVTGLPPLRLFLKIAGIELFSPNKIALWGDNPFPWPISIRWQGLYLKKEGVNTHVTFPNGAEFDHQSEKPVLLTTGLA